MSRILKILEKSSRGISFGILHRFSAWDPEDYN